ncbi:hypothetical protein B0H16DRAFT_1516699 [Mycena metata]|uniref:Uncharacterized protein n=1 Tax=Mycena metata TaxID=1033252 RepID=A0AAD7JR99_9AGAR|nr:hypothetical protein B0H16DRAFT_1516699 [Mycena metata]
MSRTGLVVPRGKGKFSSFFAPSTRAFVYCFERCLFFTLFYFILRDHCTLCVYLCLRCFILVYHRHFIYYLLGSGSRNGRFFRSLSFRSLSARNETLTALTLNIL